MDFQPVKVLKVYKQSYKSQYYIEIHDVRNDQSIGTGRPLTQRMMRQLVSAAHVEEKSNYFLNPMLDPRLLSVEPLKFKRHIIWYDKPGPRKLIFTKGMKLKDGVYEMPGILYFLHMGKLRVFAIKNGRSRPTLQTQLYYPPLFNTVGDFQFCWGSVKAQSDEATHIDTEMLMWEEFLWNSKWSHRHEANEKQLLATKNGERRFNTRKLVTAGMTLEGAIRKYL